MKEAVTSWDNGNFTGVTDSLGNTYTHVTGADTNGGDNQGFTAWYVAPVTTGGSATITAVDGNARVTYSSITVLQFSGVDTTNPVDVSGHHDGYAATETVTGFSTNYATDVILQASHHDGVAAGTYTVAPSGMTLAYGGASNSPDRPVYYQVQSSTQSSIGVGLTCGSGTTYGMAVIALRPAVQ